MKRFLLSVVCATSLVFSSCQFDDSAIWDKINDHEKRIVALEELCKQMNTNISSLQSIVEALQKNDYITNVSPVRKDGEEIGHTITFAYGDTITIYHGTNGKDGANGKDGKDGYTPQIGVMKDTDGIYYWTVDGEWLLDGKGNKIQANGVNGTNGNNGQDGTNGTNGVDGITPRLKIENDYWYVSYDNGATWTELGKATGENGSNGEDGDSIFNSVTQDDEYVYFNLTDGTMITLPKHDKENIQFEDLQVKAICCKKWDTNKDGELSYAEAAAVETIGKTFSENSDIISFTELKYFTGIIEIPDSAFYGCTSLWKVELPKNIMFIGANAFLNCIAIYKMEFPSGLLSIGNGGFLGCARIAYIDIPDTVVEIGGSAFSRCSGLIKTTIPQSVTNLGEGAFNECTGELYINCNLPDPETNRSSPVKNSDFLSITIGKNVTYIGRAYFSNCHKLIEVVIPESVTEIAANAFFNCEALTNVIIPQNVIKIGSDAFKGCTSLQEVYCKPTTPPTISFSGSDVCVFPFNSNLSIYIPRDSYSLYINHTPAYDSYFSWARYKNYYKPYDFV